MRSLSLLSRHLVPAVVLALGGCSSSASVGASDAGGIFLAQESDFDGYHQWTTYREDSGLPDSVSSPSADGGMAVVHNGGLRIEYINKLPPHGSTEFPVGTIIVKEIPAQNQVFAMVKRGGSYNPYDAGTGASAFSNWEWFELSGTESAVSFLWQGAIAPANQAYSGSDPYVCNQCHSAMGHGNDFVASPEIRLARY